MMPSRVTLCFLCIATAASKAADACDWLAAENNAVAFFDACEAGEGWNVTQAYVASDMATFSAQVTDALPVPKLSEVTTIKEYSEWMVAIVKGFGPKATWTLKARAIDATRHTALFQAVFAGVTDYLYSLKYDPRTCKIVHLTKIWNDGWAAGHLPH